MGNEKLLFRKSFLIIQRWSGFQISHLNPKSLAPVTWRRTSEGSKATHQSAFPGTRGIGTPSLGSWQKVQALGSMQPKQGSNSALTLAQRDALSNQAEGSNTVKHLTRRQNQPLYSLSAAEKGSLEQCTSLGIYTMEYYSAIKKNEIGPSIATWLDLEIDTLNEVSQTEKERSHDITYIGIMTERLNWTDIGIKKWYKWTYL